MNRPIDKPIVHYTEAMAIGTKRSAFVKPVDHPNHIEGHSISNEKFVMTSLVVSLCERTGRIETKNTIYVPLDSNAMFNHEKIVTLH